jgi:outer membrane protein
VKRAMGGALMLLCAACVTHRNVGTSDAPAKPWTPPANVSLTPERSTPGAPATAPILPPADRTITLPEIVDIALSNNPQTRIAWLEARAAEAGVGSRESLYYPSVDLTTSVTRGHNASSTGSSTSTAIVAPSLAFNYLLFDFGGRAAAVEDARQSLIAANFLHNQAIQDVVLRVEQSYYGYLDAKALLTAQDATIKERQTNLDAADARHKAGIATIADVLQARTALSQALLTRDSIEGQLRTLEGSLATAMGLPATTRFDLGELPLDVPAAQVTDAVDALITRAVQQRPELAAQRAFAERAQQRVIQTRSAYLPSIAATSTLGETFFGTSNHATPYSAGVALRWPVFTGFRNTYDVRQAELNAQAAREDVRAIEQQIDLEVWSSYYALQTATKRLGTARDLLASAQQSADVAQSRYRAGVGSILDLLTAEAALESARAQEVQARADWFVAVAALSHATGTLR